MELWLTDKESITLEMFLRMTKDYRDGEAEACAELSGVLDETGQPEFPNMAANAIWWTEANEIINTIIGKLG